MLSPLTVLLLLRWLADSIPAAQTQPVSCMWLNEKRGTRHARAVQAGQPEKAHSRKRRAGLLSVPIPVPSGSSPPLQMLSCLNVSQVHQGGPERHSAPHCCECPALCSGSGSWASTGRGGAWSLCSRLNPTQLTSWDCRVPTLFLQTVTRYPPRGLGAAS